jgi:hypothetical protein
MERDIDFKLGACGWIANPRRRPVEHHAIVLAEPIGINVTRASSVAAFRMDVADDYPGRESNIDRDDVLHSLVGSDFLFAAISA